MNTRLPPSLGTYIVGVLLACGGLFLIVAALFFAVWPGIVPICMLLGAAMLLAGVGLCRARAWAWGLALTIAITGLAVVFWRLLENGEAEWPLLVCALVTDLIITIVLVGARPDTTMIHDGGPK